MQIDRDFAKVLDDILFDLYLDNRDDDHFRVTVEKAGYEYEGTMKLLEADELITLQWLVTKQRLISITKKGRTFYNFKGFVYLVDEQERNERIFELTESSVSLSKRAIFISWWALGFTAAAFIASVIIGIVQIYQPPVVNTVILPAPQYDKQTQLPLCQPTGKLSNSHDELTKTASTSNPTNQNADTK